MNFAPRTALFVLAFLAHAVFAQYGGMGGMGGMGQMGGGQMMFKYERATTRISHTGAIESEVTRKRNLLAAAQAAQAAVAANTAVPLIGATPLTTSASSPTTSGQASQRIALRVNGAPVAASDTK